MVNELIETWLINNRVNLLLLRELSQEALETTLSTRGGRTVGMQLAHLYWVRREKMKLANKQIYTNLPEIGREQGHEKATLMDGFERSGGAVAELIRRSMEKRGKVTGFKRGIVALIGYFIAHEAHHRGHIMLTLKQAKVKFDTRQGMALWEWNKI